MSQDNSQVEQRTPHPEHDSPQVSPDPGIVLQLLREMREQRESLQAEHARAALERQSERRWRMFFQGLFFAAPLIIGILYFLFFLSSVGFHWGPFTDVVGVVRIEGQIAAGTTASADKVIPALEKAFSRSNVKAIVLAIDSPGGAPVEAERIHNVIVSLKAKYNKPVIAVISNLGASAAYLVALRADKIVAGKYSLVGSIGAIMTPWDLHRAIDRLDVSQRVYASGKFKAFLNPFTPVSPEVDAKASILVNQMGQTFVDDLKAARGASLKAGIDYGSGEVWGGIEAKELGLVDAIGTVDDVVASTWGLKTYTFGPHPDSFGVLTSSLSALLPSVVEHFLESQRLRLQ